MPESWLKSMAKRPPQPPPAPQCGHRDIDYLGADIVLAKLAEACE